MAPLSTLLPSILFSSVSAISSGVTAVDRPPANAAYADDLPVPVPTFYATLRRHYPNAQPSAALAGRTLATLYERNYYGAGNFVLLGSSLCNDGGGTGTSSEVYNQISAGLLDDNPKVSTDGGERSSGGGENNLAGVGGIPFAGPSGFDAFFSSVPSSGGSGGNSAIGGSGSGGKAKALIVYGPTVGITDGGEMGAGGGCNAIVLAYNALREEVRGKAMSAGTGTGTSAPAPAPAPAPALGGVQQIEMLYLIKELRKRLPLSKMNLAADSGSIGDEAASQEAVNDDLAKITYATYDIISDLLQKEVDTIMQRTKRDTFWDDFGELVMLGGITISPTTKVGGGGRSTSSSAALGEYFQPIIFQSLTKTPGQTFVVTDNLLDTLADTSGGKARKKTREGVGVGVGGGRADKSPPNDADFDLSSLIIDARKADVGAAQSPPIQKSSPNDDGSLDLSSMIVDARKAGMGAAPPPSPMKKSPTVPAALDISDETIKKGAVAFGGAAVVGGAFAALGSGGNGDVAKGDSPAAGPASRQPAPTAPYSSRRSSTMQLPSNQPPADLPMLVKWRRNANDGSISGNIYGSKSFSDGSYITTSPTQGTPYSGDVIETSSGSRYYLGERPERGMTMMLAKNIQTSTKPRTTSTVQLSSQRLAPPPAQSNQKQKSVFEGWFGRREKPKKQVMSPLPTNPATASIIASLSSAVTGTDRGQSVSRAQKAEVASLIAGLEALAPIQSPTESPRIEGTWELMYTDTSLVLTSPFFLARRGQCRNAGVGGELAFKRRLNSLQGSSTFGTIGTVRQIVTQGRLISEIELTSSIEGAIVSEATIRPTLSGTAWDVFLSSTELRGSNVDLVRQLLNIKTGATLPGGDLFADTRTTFATTYLDDTIRISRDENGGCFVFQKVSDKTRATDYSNIDPLGLVIVSGSRNM